MKKQIEKMKSSLLPIFGVLLILTAICTLACACNDKGSVEKDIFHSVRYDAEEGGHIEGNREQMVKHGEDATWVYAMSDKGFRFSGWSDGKTEPMRTDANVTEDIKVTARFEKVIPVTYTVAYIADNGGRIEGDAVQVVERNAVSKEVKAVPDIGYRFVGWSDGNPSASRSDSPSSSDITVIARFEFLYESGKGNESEPFIIATYEQLLNVREYPNCAFLLDCDIDLAGVTHNPIFDENVAFAGTFDGGGHAIKNMRVSATDGNASLFGVLGSCTVKNLDLVQCKIIIENIDLASQSLNAGGLAGISRGKTENCHIDIELDIKNLQEASTDDNIACRVGGMFGYADSVQISNCSVKSVISVKGNAQQISLGGMFGSIEANGTAACVIKECEIDADIKGEGAERAIVEASGFASTAAANDDSTLDIRDIDVVCKQNNISTGTGFIAKAEKVTSISACYIQAEIDALGANGLARRILQTELSDIHVTADLKNAGTATLFAYEVSHATLHRCSACGIISQAANRAYGFAFLATNSAIDQCYADGEINGSSTSGFIMGIVDSSIKNCYSTVDIFLHQGSNMVAAGFGINVQRSDISSCYYAGAIENIDVGDRDFSRAAFLFDITDSTAINCHMYAELTGLECSAYSSATGSSVEIKVYDDISSLYDISEELDKYNDEKIWASLPQGLPYLINNARHA